MHNWNIMLANLNENYCEIPILHLTEYNQNLNEEMYHKQNVWIKNGNTILNWWRI